MMPDDPINDGADGQSLPADEYREEARIFDDATVTDDGIVDPITIEQQGESDDPVKILGVPPQVLKEELDKRAFSGTAEPRSGGEPRTDVGLTTYEGTGDDVYNAQEDAFDQASDEMENQEEIGGQDA